MDGGARRHAHPEGAHSSNNNSAVARLSEQACRTCYHRGVRILVTNDDGIDSEGLVCLARAMTAHGDVTVVAPDREYSGASAALGAIHEIRPEVRRVPLEGAGEAWSVSGPPGLCVMFATLGVFDHHFDLVVSGINPGANVGRSICHSGTVGAAVTARNRGIPAVAVSQSVAGFGVEGQAWDEMLQGIHWDSAAEVTSAVVAALAGMEKLQPLVVNINVPNLPVADMAGWSRAGVGTVPPRVVEGGRLDPVEGHPGTFRVTMDWGDAIDLPAGTDGGVLERDRVAITFLNCMADVSSPLDPAAEDAAYPAVAAALDGLLAST